MSEKNEITLKDFKELWRVMSKRAYKKIESNLTSYMFYVQCFSEQFHFSHLQLSREELKEFGYQSFLVENLSDIKMVEVIESLLFVGANFAFNQDDGLKMQAYSDALNLYLEKSSDQEILKEAVRRRYEGNYAQYGESFLNTIPDELYVKKLQTITMSFKGFTKDEQKYLKHGLTTKKGLDESIVFDMEDIYNRYMEQIKDIN